jgi:hypothetical protein
MTMLLRGQVFLAEALAGLTALSSRPERSVVEGPAVSFRPVLTHPLKTLGIQVRGGRVFDQDDVSTEVSAPTVVISQAFAHSFWPNENPVDKVILESDGTSLRVVGVVRDTKLERFGVTDGPRIYRLQTHPQTGDSLIFGFEGDSSSLARSVEAVVKGLDTDLIVTPRTVGSEIDDAATAMQGLIELMIMLASGTVLLALIGIYGVVWFTVSRRTKEMGIRIALGATRHGVVYHVLRSNLRPVYVGLVAGFVLAAIGLLAMKRISSDGGLPSEVRQSNDVCCGIAAFANCGPCGDAGSGNTGSAGRSGAGAAPGVDHPGAGLTNQLAPLRCAAMPDA